MKAKTPVHLAKGDVVAPAVAVGLQSDTRSSSLATVNLLVNIGKQFGALRTARL